MSRLLAWVSLAILATYLIFVGGNWWGIYTSDLRLVTMLSAAGVLTVWVVIALRDVSWRPRTVMWPAIVASIVSLTISTVFSRFPRVSLEYLGYAVILVALYLLLVQLMAREFFRRRLQALAAMLFALTTGAFLLRIALTWVDYWRLVGHVTMPPLRPGFEGLTFGNPSAVLTMVALLSVPTAGVLVANTRRGYVALAGILGALAPVALISGSRAGWLALGITMILIPALWLSRAANRRSLVDAIHPVWRRTTGRMAVGLTLVGSVGLLVALAPLVLRRLLDGGESVRLAFSAAALRMFESSPTVGTGPGTWVIQRMAYTMPGEPDVYIPHAHSVIPQSLAELGAVGAIAGVILVANIVWLLRSAMREQDAARGRWAWFTASGLLYFFLHQALDFYLNMPAFLFVAALPIALLDATADRQTDKTPAMSPTSRVRPLALGAAGIVVLVVAATGLMRQEGPAAKSATAVAAANRNDWTSAAGPARSAANEDPDVGSYQLTAGLAEDRLGDHAAAMRAFQRVATRDDLPEGWLNLAAEQAALGMRDDALKSIDRALRIGAQRPALSAPAGDLALRLGDPTRAAAAFAAALDAVPSWASDPWWREDQPRVEALKAAVAIAEASPGGATGWELALMSGDVTRAIELGGGPGASGFVADVIHAWEGDDAATTRVIGACEAQPLDVFQVLWCGRVEARRGNPDGAKRFRELAEIVLGSSSQYAGEFRVARVVYSKISGEAADLWGLFTYRRPTPWDVLVPSLVHLTST